MDDITRAKKQYIRYKKYIMAYPKLKYLFLELTTRCNEHCLHCGSSCGDKSEKDILSCDEICDFLKKTKEQFDISDFMLCVTGGEPLLREDFFEIMGYAHKLGYHWGMTSNGTLINDDIAQKLKETGMRTISISLDGLSDINDWFRQKKGGYDLALNGFRSLNKIPEFNSVQITTVIHKKNIHQLNDLYELMLKENVKSWRIINIEPIGRAKESTELLLSDEEYRILFNFIKEKRAEKHLNVSYGCSHYLGDEYENKVRGWNFICLAGTQVASIMYNGDIGACLDIERRPELIQGNIKKDDFKYIWDNRFKIFRKSARKCKGCKHNSFCMGDSFHTWNFEENRPNFCFKNILFK